MGIPRGSARLLLHEAKQRPFQGTLLQLGRSSLYFTQRQLEDWAKKDGFTLDRGKLSSEQPALSHDPRLAEQGCMSDVSFFKQLGFDRVESSDITEWEGADHIFDLNQEIPQELEQRFDVIFETGTIVQIFHLPRVLENLFRMLKPGGRIIHSAVPSNNHMDLGFYMLCPTFFSDFYSANGWRIDAHFLCEYFAYWHAGRLYTPRFDVYEYTPGCLDPLSYGRYGKAQAATFLVATRLEESTGDQIPQLGQYQASWQHFDQSGAEKGQAAGEHGEPQDNNSPSLFWLKHATEQLRRRLLPRSMPRRVARL